MFNIFLFFSQCDADISYPTIHLVETDWKMAFSKRVQVLVKVDGVKVRKGKGVEGIIAAFSALYVGLSTLHEEYTDLPAACHSKDY